MVTELKFESTSLNPVKILVTSAVLLFSLNYLSQDKIVMDLS